MLPYDQYLQPLPGLPAAADDGVQRQARDAGRHAGRLRRPAPVFWGEPGTNGQHSFYQLIHQGTKLIPADFIGFAALAQPAGIGEHHDLLMSNVFAQAEALAFGKTGRAGARRGHADGGRRRTGCSRATARPTRSSPSELTPARPGHLIALYEHSVFTQGAIWAINSFDQWGVELGKALAKRIIRRTRVAPPSPTCATTARRTR